MRLLNGLLFFAGLVGYAAAGADELATYPVLIKDGHIIPARLEVNVGWIKRSVSTNLPGNPLVDTLRFIHPTIFALA